MYNASIKIVYRDQSKMVFRVFPDAVKLKYLAGQYGALGLNVSTPRVDGHEKSAEQDGMIKRAYSLSSSILDENSSLIDLSATPYYEFYIDLVLVEEKDKPRLSARLFSLKDGDRIFMGPKIVGHYNLSQRQKAKNVLFIATTTGEAPHNAMITQLLFERDPSRICNIILSEKSWICAYESKHQELMKEFPNYKYLSYNTDIHYQKIEGVLRGCLSDKKESIKTLGWELSAENTHVFLCGDPQMIGAPVKLGGWQYEFPVYGLMRVLKEFGFEPATRFQSGNISYESYW